MIRTPGRRRRSRGVLHDSKISVTVHWLVEIAGLILPGTRLPMKLPVVMPVFNEPATIRETVARVRAVPDCSGTSQGAMDRSR